MTDPDVIADPYPLLAELRETAPVHKLGFADYWILTRFEDCRAVLRDQRLGKPEPGDLVPSLVGSPTRDRGGDRSMLFVNPPDHTRLRSLVSRAFTPRRVELLRMSIETMTGELLDDLAGSGGGDLMARLAFPLPANVIGELVGIPGTIAIGCGRSSWTSQPPSNPAAAPPKRSAPRSPGTRSGHTSTS